MADLATGFSGQLRMEAHLELLRPIYPPHPHSVRLAVLVEEILQLLLQIPAPMLVLAQSRNLTLQILQAHAREPVN